MPEYTATCHTDGCGNADIGIPMTYEEGSPPGGVQCGVCGQAITDTEGLPVAEGKPS
jgi:hypothetical protein